MKGDKLSSLLTFYLGFSWLNSGTVDDHNGPMARKERGRFSERGGRPAVDFKVPVLGSLASSVSIVWGKRGRSSYVGPGTLRLFKGLTGTLRV